ncbi:MAG: hypothetical protein KDA37_04125 [Planctomycetales bacterium]|nr:hypothetical protein [Planctomycetales bacterium]
MPQSEPSRFRPSDLVPWADPYIASLVRGLQRQVREEREEQFLAEIEALEHELSDPWAEFGRKEEGPSHTYQFTGQRGAKRF